MSRFVNMTLGLVSGFYDARCRVTETSTGLTSAWSNTVTNFSIVPNAPVLILVSATNFAWFTVDVDNYIAAGDTIELQVQTTGGSWSSLTTDQIHTITSGEDAANEIDLTVILPNGSYDARARVTDTVGSGLTSGWSSTVVNFTISGVAVQDLTFFLLGV